MAEIKSLIDPNVIYVDNDKNDLVQVPKSGNKILLYMDVNDFAALVSAYNSKELTSLRTQKRNNKNPHIVNSTINGLNYVLLNQTRDVMASNPDIMKYIMVSTEEFNTRVFSPSSRVKAAVPKLATTGPQLLQSIPQPLVNTPSNNNLLQPASLQPMSVNLPLTPGGHVWTQTSVVPTAQLKMHQTESEVSEDN